VAETGLQIPKVKEKINSKIKLITKVGYSKRYILSFFIII
jgi:hypothetical protein